MTQVLTTSSYLTNSLVASEAAGVCHHTHSTAHRRPQTAPGMPEETASHSIFPPSPSFCSMLNFTMLLP